MNTLPLLRTALPAYLLLLELLAPSPIEPVLHYPCNFQEVIPHLRILSNRRQIRELCEGYTRAAPECGYLTFDYLTALAGQTNARDQEVADVYTDLQIDAQLAGADDILISAWDDTGQPYPWRSYEYAFHRHADREWDTPEQT